MVAVNVESQLEKAYQELRSIDSSLSSLTGGRASMGLQDRPLIRKRIVPSEDYNPSNDFSDRRVHAGGRQVVISSEESERYGKRGRYDRGGQSGNDREYSPPHYRDPPRRTLPSSVVMPAIETKSRAVILNELKKSETKEDNIRNRRMFSNLLEGTLKKFKKDEQVTVKNNPQIEKQREVERRLEQSEKEDKLKIQREKEELITRRREKEMEIMSLRRKKAIQQYAEEKLLHLTRLQGFIQTQTKPPLFFLPAKHTLRTLELLKDSSKKIETLIDLRRKEMERELHRDQNEGEDDEENERTGLRSSIVIKQEIQENAESAGEELEKDEIVGRENGVVNAMEHEEDGVDQNQKHKNVNGAGSFGQEQQETDESAHTDPVQ